MHGVSIYTGIGLYNKRACYPTLKGAPIGWLGTLVARTLSIAGSSPAMRNMPTLLLLLLLLLLYTLLFLVL